MKTILVLLGLIISIQSCFGQVKLKVLNFKLSECDRSVDLCNIQPRIVSESININVLSITIGTVSNCAGISKPVSYLHKDTLFISYEIGKVINENSKNDDDQEILVAACDCCFEIQFEISPVYEKPKLVKVLNKDFFYNENKYKIVPITFDIVNGDTINYKDKFGFKQGIWNKVDYPGMQIYNFYDSKMDKYAYNNNYQFKAFYINDIAKTAELKTFYLDGKVEVYIKKIDFDKMIIEYYNVNGQLNYRDYYENKELKSHETY